MEAEDSIPTLQPTAARDLLLGPLALYLWGSAGSPRNPRLCHLCSACGRLGLLFLKAPRLGHERCPRHDGLHLRRAAIYLPWDLIDVAVGALHPEARVVPGKGLVGGGTLCPLSVSGGPEELPSGFFLLARHLDFRDLPHALQAPLKALSRSQSSGGWPCSASACYIPSVYLCGHGYKPGL